MYENNLCFCHIDLLLKFFELASKSQECEKLLIEWQPNIILSYILTSSKVFHTSTQTQHESFA